LDIIKGKNSFIGLPSRKRGQKSSSLKKRDLLLIDEKINENGLAKEKVQDYSLGMLSMREKILFYKNSCSKEKSFITNCSVFDNIELIMKLKYDHHLDDLSFCFFIVVPSSPLFM